MSWIDRVRNTVRLRTRLRNAGSALEELRQLRRRGFWGKGRRRTLSNITIYATNLCDSRCKHCGIWQQRPIVHLPLDIFRQLRDSAATDAKTVFGLEGGEFLLHPEAEEILELFAGREIELYTNGLKTKRILEAVRQHRIPHVIVSLEGLKDAYLNIRGIDAFDRVTALVEELRQSTRVSISYTITPWNDREDFLAIRQFCLDKELSFGLNIMHDADFFQCEGKLGPIPFASAENLPGEHPIKLEYFLGYNQWLAGELFVPCTSIFHRIVVYPNGDIPLCQQGDTGILGNLNSQSLEEIWRSAATLERQQAHIGCNRCWMSFHRYHDLFALRAMKTIMSEDAIRRLHNPPPK